MSDALGVNCKPPSAMSSSSRQVELSSGHRPVLREAEYPVHGRMIQVVRPVWTLRGV